MGTISGGSETILTSPSTTVVSLLKAFMLSFVCAFASPCSTAFSCLFAFAWRSLARISSPVSREYQTSRLLIDANSRIASRYERPTARTASRRCVSVKPRSRPAISKLAARRLTSHSNGPAMRLVEVVQVEDERAVGRGEAPEVREVGVTAELCVQARARVGAEVCGHDLRRAAVERERRDEHPPVADRDELGNARGVLLLEQRERVSIRRQLERGVERLAGPSPGPPFRAPPARRSSDEPLSGEPARRPRLPATPLYWRSCRFSLRNARTLARSPYVHILPTG